MTEIGRSPLLTLVFTDLVESTGLKARLGDHGAAAVIARHPTAYGLCWLRTGGPRGLQRRRRRRGVEVQLREMSVR